MGNTESTTAARSPAQVYEDVFVPALFEQWANIISEVAGILPGQRVLDVACGTGVLAHAAAERVGPEGTVIGLDPNEEMLAVARARSSRIEWQKGRAESLPHEPASFDRVVSQFGLMFFDDRAAGLREMMRVLRPGGRLVVAVWDAVDHSPGYAILAELLQRLFGTAIAEAFRAPFALGDRKFLRSIWDQAGVGNVRIVRTDGTVRFESIEQLVSAERACVWTLGGLCDGRQFDLLLQEAEESLRPFAGGDGSVAFTMPALVSTVEKAVAPPAKQRGPAP